MAICDPSYLQFSYRQLEYKPGNISSFEDGSSQEPVHFKNDTGDMWDMIS